MTARPLCVLLAALLLGCPTASEPSDPTPEPTPAAVSYPSMIMAAEHKPLILSRLDREPYVTVLADIEATAAGDYEAADPSEWSHSIHGRNAERAQAHALLAWLFDDESHADAALRGFAELDERWDTHTVWDINIRMPHPLMGYVNALDLMRATPWLPDADEAELRRKLTLITDQFYSEFLLNEGVRSLLLGPAQNNHPIRTAAAIGYVALAFPDDERAQEWASWAFSELDYLWGPDGRYVQPDGAVSEGPFYFGFAWGVSAAIFIAVDNLGGVPMELTRDCRNRNDTDPWAPIDCTDGEPFVFENPLRGERFASTAQWSQALALPWGSRPPLSDGYFNPFNGAALLSSFGGDGRHAWDWLGNRDRPLEMHHGADLTAHHLAYYDDGVPPAPPEATHRLFPDGGHAVLRSSWEGDALWMLLVGEAGPARKSLHQHVDGTSFSLAAFGEYLLVDPGYYKPIDLDNARTAHSPAHNLVLIDGKAAPNKGLLTNWGDADAQIVAFAERGDSAAAQVVQGYQESTARRTLAMVDGRFGVVFDHMVTESSEAREHRWRLGGYAGEDSGGSFAIGDGFARWERPSGVGIEVFLVSPDGPVGLDEPPFQEGRAPHVHQFELDRSVGHHAVLDGVMTGLSPDYVAVLAPYDSGGDRLEVTALDLGGGAGFRVLDGDDEYVITYADGAGEITGPSGTLAISSDALVYEE